MEAAAVLARWSLGALFIYMGLTKALHLNSIAAALPWFEVFCGMLLLAGVAVRGSALMLLAMLVPFSLVVLKRALAIEGAKAIAFCAVKFDCGCGNGEVPICQKLLENSLLMLISIWLLTGRGRRCSIRYSLSPQAPSAACHPRVEQVQQPAS
jgi:hypothetical protein